MKPPTVQSWNLSIQRQVPPDWLSSASYMGSLTMHLWVQRALNRCRLLSRGSGQRSLHGPGYVFRTTGTTCSTTGNTNQRRRLCLENPQEGQYLGVLNMREDGGTANYHGLLLSVQRRAAAGVNIGGNYTWSHCIGLLKYRRCERSGGYLDPNNRDFDRGNCDSDRRHVFNLTAVASTPQFANPTLRMLATGWRLSGIYRKSTGSWLTVISGRDRALIGQARYRHQRPNQILGNPYGDRNSLTNYLNPNAFAQPDAGHDGKHAAKPTSKVREPGSSIWPCRESFSFRETQRLEFRAEAFNVTNSLIRESDHKLSAIPSARSISAMQESCSSR